MQLVNWDLLRNPYNWIVVILMILIAAFGVGLLVPPTADASDA